MMKIVKVTFKTKTGVEVVKTINTSSTPKSAALKLAKIMPMKAWKMVSFKVYGTYKARQGTNG